MKLKSIKIIIICIPLFLLISISVYHIYCHMMVSQLYSYMDMGDTEEILEHIEKMPSVNMRVICYPFYRLEGIMTGFWNSKGYPLDYAVCKDVDVSVIKMLLMRGADPNQRDMPLCSTPFEELCSNYNHDRDKKIEIMVEYGADISSVTLYIPQNFRTISDASKENYFNAAVFLWEAGISAKYGIGTKHESTVLHAAATCLDTEYLDKLYHNEKRDMSFLLNEQNAHGETPIFAAIRGNNCSNCEYLISEGADISIKNNEGQTAYEVAVELGYEECIEVLQLH